ncbi:MAG: hypothetical protein ACM33T_02070 [Solirubrobacterales bacterium]
MLIAVSLPAAAMDRPKDWVAPVPEQVPNHRELWRNVVIELSSYAKGRKKDFIVLVRGAPELAVKGEREALWEELRDPDGRTFEKRLPLGTVLRPYVKAVDGVVLDGLYCGPYAFDKPLDQAVKDRKALDAAIAEEKKRGIVRPPVPMPMGPFSIDPNVEMARHKEVKRQLEREERQRRVVYAIDAMRDQGRRILSIEDCRNQAEADKAARNSDRDHVLTYAGIDIGRLDRLPHGHTRAENAQPVTTITGARNWLPMVRGDRFGTRAAWMMALEGTNQDLLVVDVAHRGADPLTKDDVKRLKYKQLGAPRLVLAQLPVGIAYDWRWYWQKGWQAGNPPFLFAPNSEELGSFYTDVGDAKWKELLGKTIAGIVDLGFDGVLIDDLDTFLWFEDLMPLPGG